MKQTNAAKIRELKAANPEMTATEIAQKLGVKPQYVHGIFYLDKKKGAPKKRGRPAKPAASVTVPDPISPIRESLRSTLLERENAELKTVIRYLEAKLYGASV